MSKLPFSNQELKSILEQTLNACEMTGRKLIQHQKKLEDLKITSKEAQGVVSNADVEAENFIIKKLKPLVKDAEFLAEESAFEKYGARSEAYKGFKEVPYSWIIDPLDGTTNYLNNMDYYGVCVSLAYFGNPILGVVHRPRTEQTYYAIKGKGAFLISPKFNKNIKSHSKSRLELSTATKKLKNSLLVTGFACEKGQEFETEFEIFLKMMKSSRGIRRMGSAALDMCLVAEGIFDGFWERGLSPWDMAASSLIASEAGAFVSDYQGKGFNPFLSTIVVGNKKIKREMLNYLSK
jgi:myo-inositol-1(or 4)-monophosphatase